MRYLTVIAVCLLQIVVSKRLRTKIYKNIYSYSTCIRLLNGTHQTGCNSNREGNIGVLHFIENDNDLGWLISKGPHEPYAVLLDIHILTKRLVDKIQRSGKVNGMLVMNRDQSRKPEHFSPDKDCPNFKSGVYKSCSVFWNTYGNALMFLDFKIPVALLHSEEDVDFLILKCYRKYNVPSRIGVPNPYPLCAVQLRVAMDAAVDTPTCMRRADPFTLTEVPEYRCHPLGDRNVYSFLREPTNLTTDSVIVLSARLDAFSLFVDIVPAGDSTVTGLVAFLAAAEALSKVKKHLMPVDKSIVFMLFNGESFDYIGSSRMLYDMEKNKLQHGFQLDHIFRWFELTQVGFGSEIYLHTDMLSRLYDPEMNNQVDKLVNMFKSRAFEVGLKVRELRPANYLPPSSIQTFLAKKIFPGLVLTDHNNGFSNKYYNSQFDDIAELLEKSRYKSTVANLTRLASAVAATLYQAATNAMLPNIQANESTVKGLLDCFLKSAQCEMFNRTLERSEDISHLSNTTYSFFVGDSSSKNALTQLVGQLLAYFVGHHDNTVSRERCSYLKKHERVFQYNWMQGPETGDSQHRTGSCVMSNVHYTEAVSPAFLDEVVTLLVGLCFFILSIVVAKQLNKHVSKLFEKE